MSEERRAGAADASSSAPQPRVWARDREWWDQSRAWHERPEADLRCVVEPGVVEAASGHTFTLTMTCGPELRLGAGAHITVEIPETWDAHLANCYRRGVRTVAAHGQAQVGYAAFVEATCSRPEVGLAVGVWWGRLFDLVDVVVTNGDVQPRDEIRLTLGTPDGNLLQAQKYAQVAVLMTGVDVAGDGVYRRAAAQPSVRVIGAAAERLRVFAPGVVSRGDRFEIKVLPVDLYSFNPSPGYVATAQLFGTDGLRAPERVALRTDDAPRATDVTVEAVTDGVQRLTVVDVVRGLSGRSNPIGVDFYPTDERVYFGEMHSQMFNSMGTGTTEEFFTWGRDVALLDFCAPANHYNHRMAVTDDVWREVVETANRFNEDGRFATFVSYEWGGASGSGHKNVYYRGDSGEFAHWYRGVHKSPEDLWQSLEGRDVLTIPHHTKFGGTTDWRFRNDRHQRLVEICSLWGISEEGGPHSVQAALAMGHRLGFIGGTDSHYGQANQGSYHVNDGNGLACVIAPSLSRDALWQALWERRCYATTGDRILLDFRLELGGQTVGMGTDLAVDLRSAGQRRLTLRVAGTERIERVEVLRNNQVVFATAPDGEDWSGEWTDSTPLDTLAIAPTFPGDRPFVFYYLRVRQRNRQIAWSSPIWLTQAGRDA